MTYRLFAAGIQKCPSHVPLYQAWACLELQDGDVLTAKNLIGEALTRDKRNGSGWLVAAQIEEKMDNHGLVGLILRRGIECAPGDAQLYIALADHEISRGKIDSVSWILCDCMFCVAFDIGVLLICFMYLLRLYHVSYNTLRLESY